MRHLHEFEPHEGGTRIVDSLDFASPLGPLGWLADRLLVAGQLRRFLVERSRLLRTVLKEIGA